MYCIEILIDGYWLSLIRCGFDSVNEAKEYCDRAMMNFRENGRITYVYPNGEHAIVYRKRYNPRADPDFYGDYDEWECIDCENDISWKEAGF